MNERPIIFSGPMVRAILDGRKTQTRRVIKPQPPKQTEHFAPYCTGKRFPLAAYWKDGRGTWNSTDPYKCPYGVPGDRLWVREMWAVEDDYDAVRPRDLTPDDCTVFVKSLTPSNEPHDTLNIRGKWRSPRFMPQWASRLTIEITDLRVERVQEITDKMDALKT